MVMIISESSQCCQIWRYCVNWAIRDFNWPAQKHIGQEAENWVFWRILRDFGYVGYSRGLEWRILTRKFWQLFVFAIMSAVIAS